MVAGAYEQVDWQEQGMVPYDQDRHWLEYFDQQAAVMGVMAHIQTLKGWKTPERHTERVYGDGLAYFLRWAEDRLPTEALMTEYVAHLKGRGLKSSTIGSKYLAPARLYLDKLRKAHRRITGLTGPEWLFVAECKEYIGEARAIKNPPDDTTTNLSDLYNVGTRLSVRQVNMALRRIDRESIAGKRDYALLHLAFNSALRLAELHRMSLSCISQDGDDWLVRVRGKRVNMDPVAIPYRTVERIREYVDAYNADLAEDDPRRITDTTPLWQPLTRSSNHVAVGTNFYDPAKGLSQQGIRQMIRRRAGIAVHDTRRTCASIAHKLGMPVPGIQALMRHKSPAQTFEYIGVPPDYSSWTMSNYVTFG